jgi:multimeric flavodoxin WrbA
LTRIVAMNGSPRRNGNTAKLPKMMIPGEDDAQYFDLYGMNIKGCSGCLYCKSHEECSIKDDMTAIYQAIRGADAVIVGSPIYMGEETSATNAFTDRLYVFLNNEGTNRPKYVPKLNKGKKGVAFFLRGSPFGGRDFKPVKKLYETHFKAMGFDEWQTYILPGIHPCIDSLQDRKAVKKGEQVTNVPRPARQEVMNGP